ncbi:MAG: DMT family transporter, partial [Candidatus Marinimicrobia bacterium]|nr:DMT family transporter [Candidatus Neomarinimicrobiota bacterium]
MVVIRLKGYAIPWDPQSIKQYATIGLLNFSLSYSLTYSGTQFIYSNVSSLLWASIPITTAVGAHFFLPGERLTWLKSGGILIGFIGVLVIFGGYGFGESPNMALGMGLVIAAVLAGTWPNIYLKLHPARANPLVLSGVAAGIGGSATLVASLLLEGQKNMAWTPQNIGILLYLAIVGTVLAWGAFYYLIQHMEVVKLSLVGFISPVIAMFMGMLLLGEYLPTTVYLGASLVMLGIFISDARRYLAILMPKR